MKAFLVSIGEELLTGQTVNSNAAWIAQQLNDAGIETTEIRVIADNGKQILRTLEQAVREASLVILTGGLGPTRDDVTRDALCRFFDARLRMDPTILADIRKYLNDRGREMNAENRDQAMVPDKAEAIRNPCGTAPGMWFKRNDQWIIALPGVPYEMREMVTNSLMPALQALPREQFILHKTIHTHGIGESSLVPLIADWESNLPGEIELAYLPSTGIVKLRLTAKGKDREALQQRIGQQVEKLLQIIPEYIWGFDDDTLESLAGERLHNMGKTLSIAESCTGGYTCHKITGVPGSSRYFTGGTVAYDNAVKMHMLEVPGKLIDECGAVSREVAESMANGAMKVFGTDYAIGITGIAGPGGGSEEKPVGTTWIAIAGKERTVSNMYRFGNNRERNIHRAANAALAMLVSFVNEK